jgi:eukaryotic-like serine/threonine-protein kinase
VSPLESPIRLGPFDLIEEIGRGGMGVVWRAVHRAQGLPAAIKVMIGNRAYEERYHADFRAEVRAMAGLDHPGVVVVLDMGEVTEQADAAHLELVRGSPWMAMEYAPMGTLQDVQLPLPWGKLRRVLLGLLEALGHAHSRGIVHRDLKPANVLLGHRDDRSEPGVKRTWDGTVRLTDFGLAHVGEERSSPGHTEMDVAGTPHFMAPEQFAGHWRDYGPWTDLYALGCIAYQLAQGRLAFTGDSMFSLAYAHTLGDRPDWDIDQRLPEGFRRWVYRLLDRQPSNRFRRAADAAWALSRLEVPEELWEDLIPLGGEHHSSVGAMPVLSDSLFASASARTMSGPKPGGGGPPGDPDETLGPAAAFGAATARVETLEDDAWSEFGDLEGPPPIPPSWRRPGGDRRSMKLVGAGLGLYELRTVPLVGRRAARDLLWGALRDVSQAGRPRALLLRGPRGTGKTRLAEWLARRAHELGAATALSGRHSEVPVPQDGLAPMLARHLRVNGLNDKELTARIDGLLEDDGGTDLQELAALVALVGGQQGVEGGVQLANPSERHAATLRALARVARDRTVLLHIDDVQWGADALGFVHRLMESGRTDALPILVVMTAQDEALAGRSAEGALLDRLLRLERTGQVEVGPLSDADRSELVRELLGFDSGLAARIDQRTDGNPLFAVQLVGDWVRRGVLVPGDGGFVLRPGADVPLPDDLDEVGAARLEQALAAFGAQAWEALQLAAALGGHVDDGEWTQACLDRELGAPLGRVRERLLDARLALPAEGGWSFAHGMLRESLIRSARREARWCSLNGTCAEMLAELAGESGDLTERIGWHLVAAGRFEEAVEPLLTGARHHLERSEPRRALALLHRRAEALDALDAGPEDRRRAEGLALLCWAHRQLGKLDEADQAARKAWRSADANGWTSIGAAALLVGAQVAHARGDLARSQSRHERARGLAEQAGMAREATQALQGLADVALRSGRRAEAEAGFREAADRFAELGRPVEQADCLRALAITVRRLDRPDEAGPLLRQALAGYEAAGNRRGMADCVNSLSEIARSEGRLGEAEDGYRRALALHEAVGVGGELARINLALVLVARNSHVEAGRIADGAVERLRDSGRRAVLGCAEAATLPSRATEARWDAFERSLERASSMLRDTETHDRDIAWVVERGGDLASEGGRLDLAIRAWVLAAEQWRAVGQIDRAELLEQTVGGT